MATDDERRKVAARLRELKDPYWAGDNSSEASMDVMGVESYLRRNGLSSNLADLIEPSESGQNRDRNQDTVQKESPGFQMACECDREALLALADDMDKQTDGSMFDAWLEDGHYIARRIREACGVVE